VTNRFTRAYTGLARFLLATVIIFLALDGVAWLFMKLPRSTGEPGFTENGLPRDDGHRNEYMLGWYDVDSRDKDQAREVLDAFNEVELVYEPFGEFAEREQSSRFLNVERSSWGARRRRTPGTPSPARIACFGGSTTFGWFVADQETWPAAIQGENWGHGSWNPLHEATLFAALLRAGYRPQVAVFMDGLNAPGRADHLGLTEALGRGLDLEQKRRPELLPWVMDLSIFRLARRFKRHEERWLEGSLDSTPDESAALTLASWREERALGKEFGVRVLIVLQPDALADYSEGFWRAPRDVRAFLRGREEHRKYRDLLRSSVDLDLSGLFREWGRPALVDNCHYDGAFSAFLGKKVSGH